MADVFEDIKKMISHQFAINLEDIEEESLLDEDLSITDLDLEDLLKSVGEKYELKIPAEKMPSFKKVSDIVSYIYDNAEIAS